METQPRPPSRTLGWLLALPLGLLFALAALLLLGGSGRPFFGEFMAVALVAFAVMFLARSHYRRSRRAYWRARMQGNAPAMILRQRYARGEITRDQFQQMMRDLREGRREPGERA